MQVTIHNSTFESWLLPSEIAEAVSIIAEQIRKDFPKERIVLMCVMKGSVVFFADLLRQIPGEVEMGFISASSYRGTASTGIVQIHSRSEISLKGKVCVLVEDIVDTGQTIQAIRDVLALDQPKAMKVATLLYKKETFLGGDEPDYVGIEIANEFVVGYGLDFDELGRNLEGIYKLKG
ncbi:MAG: hypoxanthine phosphoribosyltransferase [Bacteroidetes bacterium]|jgi:hypoxanthine phosphoribosyltransferase|nr:hypoxanthine phosphoribosyltransferase [Bacteroidota bacterium]